MYKSVTEHLNKKNNLTDVAPKGIATQSSYSKWSKKDDAQRAVQVVNCDYSFHTAMENQPWWMLELDDIYPIEYILIHNRKTPRLQQKSRLLKVETSVNARTWTTVYSGCCIFGSEPDGIPLILPLQSSVTARYIKISLKNKDYLHLSKVTVLTCSSNTLKRENIYLSLGENCLTDDILKRNALKSFSTPYSSGRTNIQYALFNEKTDFQDLLKREYLVYGKTGDENVVLNTNFPKVDSIFSKIHMNGFEFTHHDVIANDKERESLQRKVSRLLDIRGNKNITFLYHYRLNNNMNYNLLHKNAADFISFYKPEVTNSKIVIFSQKIISDNSERRVEIKEITPYVYNVVFYVQDVWAGTDVSQFWAKNDDDLIKIMVNFLKNIEVPNDKFLKNKTFLAKRTDGFGARIRAMVNAIALSEYFKVDFRFNYMKREGNNAKFHSVASIDSIFSNEFISKYHIDTNELSKSTIVEPKNFDMKIINDENKFYNIDHINTLGEAPILNRVLTEMNYKEFFSKIEFTEKLEDAKNNAYNIDLNKPTIAIHLRAGDIVYGNFRYMPNYVKFVIPYTMVFGLIERYKKENYNIIIFGQDNELCNYLVGKYGIQYADSLVPKEFNNEQRSLFDIVLMSRCKKIIAGNSGFSLLSSYIGGIEIIDPNSIYSTTDICNISLTHLRTNLKYSGVSDLQTSFACLYTLAVCENILLEEDYFYLTGLGFKKDPTNYYFIILEIVFLYKTNNPLKAESLAYKYLSNDIHSNNFYNTIRKSSGPVDNRRSILHSSIKYFTKYAELDFPIAALIIAMSVSKNNTRVMTKKYADIYFKYKNHDLHVADEFLLRNR
jgi:hypothetical protein